MAKKYFWLKLKKDFFKRHDVRIIKGSENGKEIVLFYLMLLAESVDHEGRLRFSESLPYTNKMLALITETDEKVVGQAMDLLKELDMVRIEEDGTIYLPETESLIGFESDWARQKKEWREKKKTELGQSQDNVQKMSEQCPIRDRDRVRDRDRDIKRNTKEKRFSVPTLEEVSSYCQERNNGVDAERFINYYESKGWKVGSSPMKDWRAAVRTWEKNYTAKPCEPTASKYDINWDEV